MAAVYVQCVARYDLVITVYNNLIIYDTTSINYLHKQCKSVVVSAKLRSDLKWREILLATFMWRMSMLGYMFSLANQFVLEGLG